MKEKYDKEPISVDTCARVSMTSILYNIVVIKENAITKGDKDLYEIADSLESQMKILMDNHNSFERW